MGVTNNLTNTDGSPASKKALKINQTLSEVKKGIALLAHQNAEQFRIDALENYRLKLEHDLEIELTKWSWENMW